MSGKKYVFDYQDYRPFLVEALGGAGKRTGQRGALARHLGCQTAYLSQVLGGSASLSLEQAFRVNSFLGHETQAAEYFMLLVQKDRAGSRELKDYFQSKIEEMLRKRSEIKERIEKNKAINDVDQAFYYSQWFIAAIHIALSIPHLQTSEALSRHFQLDERLVGEVLEFLLSTGLAIHTAGRFKIGPSHIHLPKDSHFIPQLHKNWRLRSIQSLEAHREDDLHYSVTYSLSKTDAARVRAQILDVIEKNMAIVRPSKEEVLYCNTIDFFEIKGAL